MCLRPRASAVGGDDGHTQEEDEEKKRKEKKRKEKKRKEKKRKEKKRKEKTTPFGVNLMRSQVLYPAA